MQREGDALRLGRQVGGDTVWLDDIEVGQLPGPAREIPLHARTPCLLWCAAYALSG